RSTTHQQHIGTTHSRLSNTSKMTWSTPTRCGRGSENHCWPSTDPASVEQRLTSYAGPNSMRLHRPRVGGATTDKLRGAEQHGTPPTPRRWSYDWVSYGAFVHQGELQSGLSTSLVTGLVYHH